MFSFSCHRSLTTRTSRLRPGYLRVALMSLTMLAALALAAPTALAQESADPVGDPVLQQFAGMSDGEATFVDPGVFVANNLWILVAAALVFIMHAGFATLESGLCRSKNTVNILTKNVAIVCIGLLTYYVIGFNLMYPGDSWIAGKWLGFAGFGLDPGADYNPAGYTGGNYTYWADFIFQGMFAATCATIVSGAVAERIKFLPFIIFSILFVALLYPLTGSWKWGAGWLGDETGLVFYDFAGSTVVHAVGGAGALIGALFLGPRIGKYGPDGKPRAIPGHSMPLAAIGVFLLFLGWFGFNGGSVLSADPEGVSFVFVTTGLAAAAGGLAAMIASAATNKGKVDLTMALNGILAGLVGITAGADVITPMSAILVGLIAGAIVVFAVYGFDAIKIDDPVGAISVHLVCGVWGTLAVGLFGNRVDGRTFTVLDANTGTLGIQLLGCAAMIVTSALFAAIVFGILKLLGGIRVSEHEEIEGLDVGEHGMHAYPDFAVESVGSPGYITTPSRAVAAPAASYKATPAVQPSTPAVAG